MARTKRDLTDPQVQGRLLTLEQGRRLLGVSLATIYRYMAEHGLRFRKLNGKRWLIESELACWKEERQVRNHPRARLQRRAAAHALHARYDSRELTRPARDAFLRRFELAVDPQGTLPTRERKRRAQQAKKAYFTDLARRSSKARGRDRGRRHSG